MQYQAIQVIDLKKSGNQLHVLMGANFKGIKTIRTLSILQQALIIKCHQLEKNGLNSIPLQVNLL